MANKKSQKATVHSQNKVVLSQKTDKKTQKAGTHSAKGCVHKGESPFMTPERRVCPVCKKIYYFEYVSWNPALINRDAYSKVVTE